MIRRAALVIIALVVMVMASSCVLMSEESSAPLARPEQWRADEPLEKPDGRWISAWVVYWDQGTAMDELAVLQDSLGAVCHFSAVFDSEGHLSIPEDTSEFYRSMRDESSYGSAIHYLTVVNDVVYENKPSSQKDTNILKPLLADEESRAAHIEELLELTEKNGYDGLEIDYETLHRQKGLAEDFALFCEELWEAANQKGIYLRVVLEPTFPVNKIELPHGPEYVIMFYNLHGYHSGPGPKADAKFIRNVVEDMSVLPGEAVYAFSTGGFDWSKGSVKALNESQAWDIISATNSDFERDPDSGCVFFDYTAEDGSKHTVWFADGETLNYWIAVSMGDDTSRQFVLWRLGGNDLSSLQLVG